jgi:hypothetical protein
MYGTGKSDECIVPAKLLNKGHGAPCPAEAGGGKAFDQGKPRPEEQRPHSEADYVLRLPLLRCDGVRVIAATRLGSHPVRLTRGRSPVR